MNNNLDELRDKIKKAVKATAFIFQHDEKEVLVILTKNQFHPEGRQLTDITSVMKLNQIYKTLEVWYGNNGYDWDKFISDGIIIKKEKPILEPEYIPEPKEYNFADGNTWGT